MNINSYELHWHRDMILHHADQVPLIKSKQKFMTFEDRVGLIRYIKRDAKAFLNWDS
jgi:hypothetical protein